MVKEKASNPAAKQGAEEVLKDILIVQLAVAGLTKHQIRETVGVDMNRVTRLLKYIKTRGNE